MTTSFTEQMIQRLVVDAGALRDGRKLANLSKWRDLGRDERAAWGRIQGSGKDPYKTSLSMMDGATKCSCPSRKFPCKHAAALMFLLASGDVPSGAAMPDWVNSWIAGRERKEQTPKRAADSAPDPAAQAKRQAAREAKVEAGIEELRRWLEDLVRYGLGDARVKTYAFWDGIAARMVDAQMSPIAARLRRLGGSPFQRQTDWVIRMGDEVGQLYALTEAYARLDSLPEPLQHDVRGALGFATKQEDVVISQPAVRDLWHVVGQITSEEDRIVTRRTWLYGESCGQYALLLDFSPRNRSFRTMYPLGTYLDAEMVYYPSAYPQRAVLKQSRSGFRPTRTLRGFTYTAVDDVLTHYADALAANPFLRYIPAGIQRAWVTRPGIDDPYGKRLPLGNPPSAQWLLAVTGGMWLPVFGEWNGETFCAASLVASDGFTEVTGQ